MRIGGSIAVFILCSPQVYAGDTSYLTSTNSADINIVANYDRLDIRKIRDVSISASAIGASTSVKLEVPLDAISITTDTLIVENTTMENDNSGQVSSSGRFIRPKGLNGPGTSSLSIIAAGTMSTIAINVLSK